MTEKELLNLKNNIDQAKKQISELEGERKALLKQLESDWGCKTIEEAHEKADGLSSAIETLNQSIQQGLQELDEKYNTL